MDVYILIPAYNEEKNIGKVVREARKFGKVVVVDDGSSDATANAARDAGADVVLRNRINMGKGFALRKGFKYILKMVGKEDAVVTMDADLQHDAKEIPKLLRGLKQYHIVVGCRDWKKMPFVKKVGNLILSMFASVLFSMPLIDTQSGFRAYRAEVIGEIVDELEANDYFIDTEILILARKKGFKVGCSRIATIYRDLWKGTSIIEGISIGLKMVASFLFQ